MTYRYNVSLSQLIADYWSNMRFRRVVSVFNTLVRGVPLNSGPRKFASRNYRNTAAWSGVDILRDDYFVLSQRTRLTDRRNSRQQERALT